MVDSIERPTAASNPDNRGPMNSTQCERLILDLARRQHGLVARAQLIRGGVPGGRIDYRLRTGRLSRVFRGVYAVGPVVAPLRRPMAAILLAGDGAWLGFDSALAFWQLARAPAPDASIHILTVRDVRSAADEVIVHRTARVEADEVTIRDGVPVTAPARTILDYAATAPRREIEYAIGRAHRAGLLEPADLLGLLDRYRRRPGVSLLRLILDEMADPTFVRSEAERRLIELLRVAGLPLPRTNRRVIGLEVDFVYPEERLVIEVDGRAYHSGDPAFERDHERDNLLVAADYEVIRLTWRKITRRPEAVAALVAGALGRRARLAR